MICFKDDIASGVMKEQVTMPMNIGNHHYHKFKVDVVLGVVK